MLRPKKKKIKANSGWYSPNLGICTRHRLYPDSQWFGSQIELAVYKRLVQIDSVRVIRQYPLTIKNATAAYPKKQWRCDFRIEKIGNPNLFLNIEAKGTLYLKEFKPILQYLEFFSPIEFSRLLIVGTNPMQLDRNNAIVSVDDMMYILGIQGLI